MKGIVQINVADDDGMQIIVGLRKFGTEQSFTIGGENLQKQDEVVIKSLNLVRNQIDEDAN